MEKTQVFELNQKNEYVKKLRKGFVFLGIYPLITLVILLLFFAVFYLISTAETLNNNDIVEWVGNNASIVIQIFIGIVIIEVIIGIFRIIKNLKIQNSLIIKEGKDIMLLYKINEINQLAASAMAVGGLAMDKNSIVNASISKAINASPNIVSLLGLGMYLAGTTNAKVKEKETIKPLIKEIVDNPRTKYKFYTDCKLLTETKNYYLFNGTNIDYAGQTKNENFKIYKIYSNIEQLVK